mgnify:CR=1
MPFAQRFFFRYAKKMYAQKAHRNDEKGAVKNRVFYSPFSGDREKRRGTDKPSKIRASDLILLARMRTKVRRAAKFVCR